MAVSVDGESCGFKMNGKIMAHITPEFQKKWLGSRAQKLGFSVDEAEFQTVQSKWYDFRKRMALAVRESACFL